MIRWAGCGLLALLTGGVACGQSEKVIQEVSELLDALRQQQQQRPNPLGGAPIVPPPQFLAQRGPVPIPVPDVTSGTGSLPRPIRPVYTLPGTPKLDRHGDPLPAGAVVRYGTVRLRHGTDIQGMGFTPDGKYLCTVSGSEDSIKLWDPVSGKEAARLNSAAALVGLAKNGSVFLVDETRVRVWLPATNTVRDLPEKTVPEGANPTALAVNPDGRSFALAVEGKVLLIDAQSGKALRELNLPALQQNPNVARGGVVPPPGVALPNGNGAPPAVPAVKLMYSPDGRYLVGNGQKTGVWLWDLRTGKRVRTYRSEFDFPEYTFSPDVTKLVVTGQVLQLYALDSEEAVDGFKPPEGLLAFAPRFSADGKTIHVMTPDGSVQPIDAATGEAGDELAAPEMNLRQPFAIAPGGTSVAAIDPSGGIRIWDPKTGKGPEVDRFPPLSDPGFTADGKSVTVLDQTNKVHTFDLATGKPGKVIELPGEDNGLPTYWDSASRRAATVAPSGEELEVQIVDEAGKPVSKYQLPQNGGMPFVRFAAANRDRMALFVQNAVIVINPSNGKTVRSFNPGQAGNGLRGALSPDGRLVAVATPPMTVWEVATGKKRLTVDAVQNANEIAFSPDSRLVVGADNGGNVVVVDVRTGTVVRRLQTDANDGVGAVALSPDGKRVAAGMVDGRVTVWDVASGEVLAPFAGHDGIVSGLIFTPDGKKLVSTAQDGTALVWEIPDKPVTVGPAETAVTGFDEAFRLLSSADAAHAQRGLDYLYRNPAEAAKQVGERLPAPTATPAAKLARYVEDLGSEEFAVREAALKALEKLGGEASAVLKTAVEKSPSAEVRKSAGELLGKIDAPPTRGDDFRILRAVEAMENLRTPESRAQLERWAAGPAGHRLTVEASAALARLKALGGGK